MLNLNLLIPEKKYLLAVSGGMDSMVLCHLFREQGLTFGIAHINYLLRQDESDGDEELVTSWAKQYQIPCWVKREDAKQYATRLSCSVQEAARTIRYNFFQQVAATDEFDFIVTAHHEQDQIETMLFHYLRGSGIDGLCGIPVVNGNIIRPLLHCKKEAITHYAETHKVPFRHDSSNFKQDYTRNKIRLSMLPALKELFPDVEDQIVRNGQRLLDARSLYRKEIERLRKKLWLKRGKDIYIPLRALLTLGERETILYEFLHPYGFSFEQCLQILKLVDSESGRFVANATHRVIRYQQFFILTTLEEVHSDWIQIERSDRFEIRTEHFMLKGELKSYQQESIERDTQYCTLDARNLQFPLILRPWKPGDYLYPFGMKKKKKVARVLIDAKVPLHEKEKIWVLESDKRIVWIVGLKADERFRVGQGTTEILTLRCTMP